MFLYLRRIVDNDSFQLCITFIGSQIPLKNGRRLYRRSKKSQKIVARVTVRHSCNCFKLVRKIQSRRREQLTFARIALRLHYA